MDVIGLASAGIDEAVAPLGTALTEQQMARLWRLIDVPTLCFDGDAAGQKAAVRAAERALPVLTIGKSLRFARAARRGRIPTISSRAGGAAAWEQAVAAPAPLVSLLYRAEAAKIDSDLARGPRRSCASGSNDARRQLRRPARRRGISPLVHRPVLRGFRLEEAGARPRRASGDRHRRRTAARELSGLFIRSVLYGLTRFPEVTVDRIEAVGSAADRP